MQSDNEENKAKEPQANYRNRISITTPAALEEYDRQMTRNMSHEQRMQYLQKLISITYSDDDLKEIEKKFYTSKISINKAE